MTAQTRHPSLEDWLHWLERGSPADAPLNEHRANCERCRNEVELLRDVQRARRVRRWTEPPRSLREQARRYPGRIATPRAPRRSTGVHWAAADVRGDGLGTFGGNRVVSEVFPDAEVGIVAVPPHGDGDWRIEGRVWLRESDERPIQLLLVQEEHVVSRSQARDGEFFELEETIGPGWVLELHLPSGPVLTLKDPQT